MVITLKLLNSLLVIYTSPR